MISTNDKKIVLFDNSDNRDFGMITKTSIGIYIEGTDECIFKGSNKVILPGAGFTARGHFNLTETEKTPTYNDALGLDNTVIETPTEAEKCLLFAVGTDGCGQENSQVYNVNYAKWIDPSALVPFRYQPDTADLTGSLRDTYFGRKTQLDTTKIAYYFKAFETAPVFIQQYTDGTPIDSTIYNSSKPEEVESYVELRLKITQEDCRDFFIETSGINSARVNTISLLTGWAKTIGGIKYYQDIRPLTKLNFPNEALIDPTKGLDIIYHIYY